jgi:hypothetical protein
MKFRHKQKNVPKSTKKSRLSSIGVYCSEDRKMLGKQTAVLAETKELTSNVKSRCDWQ